MYISILLHIINQFHMKSVFFSKSRDGRNLAINTFMEQLFKCADITFSRKYNHDYKCDCDEWGGAESRGNGARPVE